MRPHSKNKQPSENAGKYKGKVEGGGGGEGFKLRLVSAFYWLG